MPRLTKIQKKIRDSLKYSIKEGSWWAVMAGFGDSYLSAFAVFLKATPFQLGMIASLPQFLASLFQLFAYKLTNIFNSRKKLVLISVFFQSLMWLIIIGISWLTQSVWLLVILASLYSVIGSIGGPAWASWMGDLVHSETRGRYFGRRNRVVGFFSFIMITVAGFVLSYLSKFNTLFAFFTLFSIASFGRFVSFFYMLKQYEPDVEIREVKKFGFLKFIREIPHNNFGMFSLFTTFLFFSVFIASPLFVIYFLRILNLSYLQYTILISASAISSFITVSYWGAHADDYGNKAVLWVSSNLLFLIPLLWYIIYFVPKSIQFPLGVGIQLMGGMAWAGFNISSGNFFYDTVKPILRIRFISYQNVMKGTAILLGGFFAGWLGSLEFSSVIVPSGIFLALLLSSLGRLIITLIFFNFINESRVVRKRPRFLHFVTVMPAEGLMFDSIVGMNRTLKTFRKRLKRIQKKLTILEKKYRNKNQ